MKLSFSILSFVAYIALSSGFEILRRDWEDWKETYGKVYSQEEESQKRATWEKNIFKIAEHNIEADNGLHSYRMQINQFGDMDESEWKLAIRRGLQRNSPCNQTILFNLDNPEGSVDWRSAGAVTPVQNQGSDGKSWTYSATGALESQNFIKHGRLIKLSEQNLADCATASFSPYCEVGGVDCAFYYVMKNGGIDTEEGYPAAEHPDGKCHYTSSAIGTSCKGYVNLPMGDETALQEAVNRVGPISVNIDASLPSFQFYSSGVYHDPDCSSTELDHAVLVVGYGIQDEKAIWIVKNSWGSSWGDKGYIMMSRNMENNCGIASEASYPLM